MDLGLAGVRVVVTSGASNIGRGMSKRSQTRARAS